MSSYVLIGRFTWPPAIWITIFLIVLFAVHFLMRHTSFTEKTTEITVDVIDEIRTVSEEQSYFAKRYMRPWLYNRYKYFFMPLFFFIFILIILLLD